MAIDEMFAPGDAGGGPATAAGKKAAVRDDADPDEPSDRRRRERKAHRHRVARQADRARRRGARRPSRTVEPRGEAPDDRRRGRSGRRRRSRQASDVGGDGGAARVASRRSTPPPLGRGDGPQGEQEAHRRDPRRHGPGERRPDVRRWSPEGDSQAARPDPCRRKYVTELDLAKALATKFGIEFLDLTGIHLDMQAAGLISEKLCRRYGVVPIGSSMTPRCRSRWSTPPTAGGRRPAHHDRLRHRAGDGHGRRHLRPSASSTSSIRRSPRTKKERRPGGGRRRRHRLARVDRGGPDRQARQLGDRTVRRRRCLRHPLRAPGERADRTLPDRRGPARDHVGAAAHAAGRHLALKIMADLDIAERRVPQDGRIGLMVGGKPIDMRVATLPTVYGEKIVIRLLDKSNVMIALEDLGFSDKALERFKESFTQAVRGDPRDRADRLGQVDHALRHAQHPQRPREKHHHGRRPGRVPARRHQPGPGQPKAGLTFAAGAPSILRCDPDIIMIGEIRDRETAADRDRIGAHRPPGAFAPCTPTTRRALSRGSPRWASSRS